MNHAFVRFVSRLLIVSLACLPFQARAELIGTNQAVSAEQAQPARTARTARASLASALQAYGVESEAAQARVAALTDAEALTLADRVADAPAGGIPGHVIGIIFVALFLIWRFTLSDQAKAEQGKK
jgi:hypothetical protein